MDKSAVILSYPVRLRIVVRLAALTSLALAPLPAIPAVVAAIDGDWNFALRCSAVFIGFLVFGMFARLGSSATPRMNEALCVMALAFVVPSIAMGWAISSYGYPMSTALFEATSGLTTTGLSVLPAPETLDDTLLFTRAWMQWVGGLGFAVLLLGVVGGAGASAARRLDKTEPMGDDPVATLRSRARRTLAIYFSLTLACMLALLATGQSISHSILFAMTALATGGFAPHSMSAAVLEGWDGKAVLIGFSCLGAVSFSLYLNAIHGKRPGKSTAAEITGLFVFAAIATVGLSIFMLLDGFEPRAVLEHGPFIALSAQTNTGFSTMDVSALPPAGLLLLLVAMWIGGNSGSTAGGVKTFRVLVIMAAIRMSLLRINLPSRAAPRLTEAGNLVSRERLESVFSIAVLSMATIFAFWLPFLNAGYGFDALFDVASAVSTTGLSTGVVGPQLEPHLKLAVTGAMLLGRVEFVALLVLIWPPTWFRF